MSASAAARPEPDFSVPTCGPYVAAACTKDGYFDDTADCFWSTAACCCCSPCTVSRAFEVLHGNFEETWTYSESRWCVLCPRTVLGCVMCAGLSQAWATAYVASHTDNPTTCQESVARVCLGQICCYSAAMSKQLRQYQARADMTAMLLT